MTHIKSIYKNLDFNKVLVLLFFIMCLLTVIGSLLLPVYDADLDHEIYFAQRLLHGNLLWTEEFHDKLPFVPFFLTVPAFFKSILVCKVFFVLIIMCSIFSYIKILGKIFERNDFHYIINFSSFFFIFLLLISYGSILTINCLSISFFIIFFVVLIAAVSPKISCNSGLLWFFGSFSAAAAISIRPYYFLPVGVTVCLTPMLFYGGKEHAKDLKGWWCIKIITLWILGIGIFGILFNIFPYLLTGQFQAFLDGMRVLLSPINPTSGWHSFFKKAKKIPDIILWLSWLVMAFLMLWGAVKGEKKGFLASQKIFFISFCDFAVLLGSVAGQHWWAHYIQLFIGNFCLCVCMCLLFFGEKDRCRKYIKSIICVAYLFSGVVLLMLLNHEVNIVKGKGETIPVWESDESNWQASMILSFFNKMHFQHRPSFLMPEDMKGHWLLDEARHHFEHASNIKAIHDGWWQKVSYKSQYFFVDKDRKEFCERLNGYGPDFVFVSLNYYIVPCLEKTGSAYRMVETLKGNKREFLVYQRKNYGFR